MLVVRDAGAWAVRIHARAVHQPDLSIIMATLSYTDRWGGLSFTVRRAEKARES
jgi:hypothetical protein